MKQSAVQRFFASANLEAIYTSMGRSGDWFYRWTKHYNANDDAWCNSQPMRPNNVANRTLYEIGHDAEM